MDSAIKKRKDNHEKKIIHLQASINYWKTKIFYQSRERLKCAETRQEIKAGVVPVQQIQFPANLRSQIVYFILFLGLTNTVLSLTQMHSEN